MLADLWVETETGWCRISANDPRAGRAITCQAMMRQIREEATGPTLAEALRAIVASRGSKAALVALATAALAEIDAS